MIVTHFVFGRPHMCCARKEYAPSGCHRSGLLDMHRCRIASSRSFSPLRIFNTSIHPLPILNFYIHVSIHVIFIIFSSLLPLKNPNAWEFTPQLCLLLANPVQTPLPPATFSLNIFTVATAMQQLTVIVLPRPHYSILCVCMSLSTLAQIYNMSCMKSEVHLCNVRLHRYVCTRVHMMLPNKPTASAGNGRRSSTRYNRFDRLFFFRGK